MDYPNLISKHGLRYVIRNYVLDEETIKKIVGNEYSVLSEEYDISLKEINEYQENLKTNLKTELKTTGAISANII